MRLSWLMMIVFVLSFGIGCNPAATNTKTMRKGNKPEIEIFFKVQPRIFPIDQLDSVRVTLGATNVGKRSVDPQLGNCVLMVNGEVPISWNLALGNGHRPEKWYALPAKQSVEQTWKGLARSLFPDRRRYQVELSQNGKVLESFEVVCE